MKLNWGKRIAVLYIGFVILVLAMVILAMTRKTELVSENYYEKEIKYQEQIDKEKRTNELNGKVKIEYSGSYILIKFPSTYNLKNIKGTINFYRPSDESKDFKLNIEPDENGEQKVATTKLLKGLWKVKINWFLEEKEYYNESSVLIN
jgi:hypothetical protein